MPNDKPEWKAALFDRMNSTYQRDKNHSAVLIWSLGNESFGGETLLQMAEMVRRFDDTRLVHYEGVVNDPRFLDTTDIESHMYSTVKDIKEYLAPVSYTHLDVYKRQVTGKADLDSAEDTLFMDYETLDSDPESLCGDERQKFDALFAPVKTTNTTDIPTHLKTIQQEWKKRGLSFVEDDKIRLVSVVLHDQFSETDNSLMIGHVGVMLPTSDAVYFVEKVAFQEPYRLLKFKNQTEFSDYLMLKYDNSWGQDTAHTFILENSDLMDGWRILEEQENAS